MFFWYAHVRTSTTQPRRLQKFRRASRGMSLGSRPIQSTREGSHVPFHPGTVFLNSSTRAPDVAGSNGFTTFARSSSSSADKVYGLSLERSMRKGCPRKVIGTRSWTRKTSSTRSSLEYTKYAYRERGPDNIRVG